MNYHRIHFYKDTFAINLLAKDLDNAMEIGERLDGNMLVGVLAKDFDTIEACADRVREYLKKLPNVSVGMGGGDPTQAPRAARVAALTNPGHVNQTFTGAISDSHEKGIVSVETAACMLRDVGVPSVKFFNMHGLKHLEELKALAQAAGKASGNVTLIARGTEVNAKRVIALMKLCLKQGETITLRVEGGQEEEDEQALQAFCKASL